MAKKRQTAAAVDQQLLQLWRTLRNDPETAAKIMAKMDPAEAERIRELWATMRAGVKRQRLPNT